MQDLVGIGVSNSTEEPGVCKGSLKCVILESECEMEGLEIGLEHLEAPRVMDAKCLFAADDVKGGSFLGPGFGDDHCAGGKLEGR